MCAWFFYLIHCEQIEITENRFLHCELELWIPQRLDFIIVVFKPWAHVIGGVCFFFSFFLRIQPDYLYFSNETPVTIFFSFWILLSGLATQSHPPVESNARKLLKVNHFYFRKCRSFTIHIRRQIDQYSYTMYCSCWSYMRLRMYLSCQLYLRLTPSICKNWFI